MTNLFYKGLTKNPEIPRLGFAQYLEMGRVMDNKFGTNVSNRISLNAAICQWLQPLPFLSN